MSRCDVEKDGKEGVTSIREFPYTNFHFIRQRGGQSLEHVKTRKCEYSEQGS